jgi:hypothetical protein
MKKYTMVLAPFFFLVMIIVVGTYALFESQRTNTSNLEIAKWEIKVNDSLLSGSTSTFVIDNFVWSTSQYVMEGKAAPGLNGYFDIVIDPNDTDTSIRYDVTFDFSNLDSDQFTITEISEIDDKSVVQTGEFTYSGIIPLADIEDGETNTLRVYIEWINDENNNDKDSELGKVLNNQLMIPVSVNITQYIDGDTLTPYVGG